MDVVDRPQSNRKGRGVARQLRTQLRPGYVLTIRGHGARVAVEGGHFTRLTLRYRYEGKQIVDRRVIRRFGSTYNYEIPGGPS
jgi:hypothetical protein